MLVRKCFGALVLSRFNRSQLTWLAFASWCTVSERERAKSWLTLAILFDSVTLDLNQIMKPAAKWLKNNIQTFFQRNESFNSQYSYVTLSGIFPSEFPTFHTVINSSTLCSSCLSRIRWWRVSQQGQTAREDQSKELGWILQYTNNISEWYKVPSWVDG